jgi:hypothetical protein
LLTETSGTVRVQQSPDMEIQLKLSNPSILI